VIELQHEDNVEVDEAGKIPETMMKHPLNDFLA
jgi:hypothetical protein